MLEYYIFLLDKEGRIFTRNDLLANNDEDAIARALKTEAPNGIELWFRQRLVWSGKPRPLEDEYNFG